ncbi:hypothetical protein QYM36_014849 [Artemia franciscana]|uniref:Trafficking protein particle complex subunit 10 n=1 Tax=Artemia franciscana TaxID=6661 RepID=A0AA88HAX7_ARTSF|nr:hypothetical protein QYM36_014849 [Artemia franciscana]KAK2706955.1 hypothetical protein QYM36_014849 [Artemia franciscana]
MANIFDFRPVITYQGDNDHFSNFSTIIEDAVSTDKAEWRRSYGRPSKSITLKPKFLHLTDSNSFKESGIRDRKVLHIFWTNCNDLELYKTSIKEKIQNWLTSIKSEEFPDWLIVCFETPDIIKKTTKLIPRSTVLERIKSEVAQKSPERCLSVCEPNLIDSAKQPEPWNNFIHKLRYYLMLSFNKMVVKYEDSVRGKRERRSESSWDFCDYFLLQDELGLVFQMLGLPEEALLIYDELEVIFTQYMADCCTSCPDPPKWLRCFQQSPKIWSSPVLVSTEVDSTGLVKLDSCVAAYRQKIVEKEVSLLEFRNYLFSQQAAILLSGYKTSELGERCFMLIQNCVVEHHNFSIKTVPGSMEAWSILTALDSVKALKKMSSFVAPGNNTRYSASIWEMAKNKLYKLGSDCGLHPKNKVESQHLHFLATLSSGFASCESEALEILQNALGNAEEFRKLYYELCEMAISAYKYCNLTRNAKYVGGSLAKFLRETGETKKAIQFLSDLARTYDEESWPDLRDEICKEIINCCVDVGDMERAFVVAGELVVKSASEILRKDFLKFLLERSQALSTPVKIQETLSGISAQFVSKELKLINGKSAAVEFDLCFRTCLPEDIVFDSIRVTIKKIPENYYFHSSTSTVTDIKMALTRSASERNFNLITDLNMKVLVSYQQDGSVSSVGVTCLNPQKLHVFPKTISEDEMTPAESFFYIENSNIYLTPGINKVRISGEIAEKGSFLLTKVELMKSQLIFPGRLPEIRINAFSITDEKFTINVKSRDNRGVLAGFPQEMLLTVKSGSYSFAENLSLRLMAPRGMLIGLTADKETFTSELKVELPLLEALQSLEKIIWVYADVLIQKDTLAHYILSVEVPHVQSGKFFEIPVSFSFPFSSSFKLYAVETVKYLNFNIHGLTAYDDLIELCEPNLVVRTFENKVLNLNFMNGTSNGALTVFQDYSISYLWELKEIPTDSKVLKANFSVKYRTKGTNWCNFYFPIDITDFQTVLKLKAQVAPSKGAVDCRAGSVCSLIITVEPYSVDRSGLNAVMFEVLQEPNVWAVCGQTAGKSNYLF